MIGMTVKLESLDWKEWLFIGGRRDSCPSSKKLLKAVRAGESKKVNRRTLEHVSRCESCSRDFRFIFGVLNEEEKLKIELETLVSERKESSLRVEKSAPGHLLSSCFRFAAYSFSVLLLMFSLSLNSSVFADRAFSKRAAVSFNLQEDFEINAVINQYLMIAESQDDMIRYECRILGDSIVIKIVNGSPDNLNYFIITLMQH
ncbi:MAG: hypothetical protein MUP70_10645 [Candidatus Aminicenantes bacterium]|nr:hypothetical protein [Candidatus Aminicenantes bacterium]